VTFLPTSVKVDDIWRATVIAITLVVVNYIDHFGFYPQR